MALPWNLTSYSKPVLQYNVMKYLPLTQNYCCHTQTMPCNTYLLLRITTAIHRRCHEILASYSESKLLYTDNAIKYLPLTQNYCCHTQTMPWNTCHLLRITTAIHRQCHEILTSYSEFLLPYTDNAMKYLPLTQNQSCYTQTMPWNTCLLLRITAAIHRQCHEILATYSELLLPYTDNAMKYLPLTQNYCCHTQTMPWNTYLFLRTSSVIHRQCHKVNFLAFHFCSTDFSYLIISYTIRIQWLALILNIVQES